MLRFLLVVLFSCAPVMVLAQSGPGVEAGVLRCNVSSGGSFIFGSTKGLICTFKPVGSRPEEPYTGTINKFGIDIGEVKAAEFIWAVLAPSANLDPGALEGNYAGVSAGAAVGAGIEANALIGGFDKSIALNPLSVAGTQGLNIQAGVASLSLKAGR
ncbi:DUF992 domain-containing protein [Rhizobiales bacterium]|uniref:DUF992 domain-containing protein n=1 Tax=Hongsoonwoonella zoysiae TaxID=2821844 RepID=UPI00155FE5D8|nr:DUF992 domain-containing protein [Hongsoonwoonella zoysiae]NRG17701.1 DUF992 domain-containing protein [Hongsoonwoonella zoysiae]